MNDCTRTHTRTSLIHILVHTYIRESLTHFTVRDFDKCHEHIGKKCEVVIRCRGPRLVECIRCRSWFGINLCWRRLCSTLGPAYSVGAEPLTYGQLPGGDKENIYKSSAGKTRQLWLLFTPGYDGCANANHLIYVRWPLGLGRTLLDSFIGNTRLQRAYNDGCLGGTHLNNNLNLVRCTLPVNLNYLGMASSSSSDMALSHAS